MPVMSHRPGSTIPATMEQCYGIFDSTGSYSLVIRHLPAPSFNASTRRSRKGVWAAFNLHLANSSEKKQAWSTSGKLCTFPERGGHIISKVFEQTWKSSGRFPSKAQA